MELTPKQERFVAEYLIDLNATQVAVRAGYSAKTAAIKGAPAFKQAGEAWAAPTAQQARIAFLKSSGCTAITGA
jgi:Phage terminase, small subunit